MHKSLTLWTGQSRARPEGVIGGVISLTIPAHWWEAKGAAHVFVVPESGWPLPGPQGGPRDIVNCPHRVGGMGRHIQTAYLAKNAFTSLCPPRFPLGHAWRRASIPFSGLQAVDTFPKTRRLPNHSSISLKQTPCPSRLLPFLYQLRPQLFRPWIPNSTRCQHFRSSLGPFPAA